MRTRIAIQACIVSLVLLAFSVSAQAAGGDEICLAPTCTGQTGWFNAEARWCDNADHAGAGVSAIFAGDESGVNETWQKSGTRITSARTTVPLIGRLRLPPDSRSLSWTDKRSDSDTGSKVVARMNGEGGGGGNGGDGGTGAGRPGGDGPRTSPAPPAAFSAPAAAGLLAILWKRRGA